MMAKASLLSGLFLLYLWSFSLSSTAAEYSYDDCEAELAELESVALILSEKLSVLETETRALVTSLRNGTIDEGNTAWLMLSSSRILFMTLPGVAIYYGGLIRSKDLITTVMHVFTIACLITMLWMFVGYSLAFSPASENSFSSSVFGDGDRLFLRGMTITSVHQNAPTVPESVFCTFQLTFAIITATFISGSFAGRMRFVPMLIFIGLWLIAVYCPLAHAVWHPDGFLHKAGVLDFAGGSVVHLSSGMSGLAAALAIGIRKGFGTDRYHAHNMLYVFIGISTLWVGWIGFNGGSGFEASGQAGNAMLVTQISGGVGAISWIFLEVCMGRKPSVLGVISGANAGLICITPACGFVNPTAAVFIGFFGAPLCYLGCKLKVYLKFDDALDNFGLHAVGGSFGLLCTGFFALGSLYTDDGDGNGVFYSDTSEGGRILAIQLYAIVVVMGWSFFVSFVVLKLLDVLVRLRVTAEEEEVGLDKAWSMALFSERFIE